MKVAIIGTRGIPANYGGFETLAEKLAENLSTDIELTVFCSSKYYKKKLGVYKNAKLKYINLGANGFSAIFYDLVSLLIALPKNDKVIMCGAPAGIFLPFLKKWNHKIVFNFGGLDFYRNKWNGLIQKFIKIGRDNAVKYSGYVISDNKGIEDFLLKEYGTKSIMIPYGADHVFKNKPTEGDLIKYPFLKDQYALVVARIQKDNNIELSINAFENQGPYPLVIIGNWSNSRWGRKLKLKYNQNPNLILIDAIYDQYELDLIRNSCYLYIHGHSAGGTNPSLIEAMYMELPVFAFNSIFNQHTTHSKCLFFQTSDELKDLIKRTEKEELRKIGTELNKIAIKEYSWKKIANDYNNLLYNNSKLNL